MFINLSTLIILDKTTFYPAAISDNPFHEIQILTYLSR